MLKTQEIIKKQNITINNAIELGEDISVEAKGKGRKFVSRFIEAGLAHYEQFGDIVIEKETIDKFIHTMVGCPIIIKHKDIDDSNVDKERVGVVSNVWYNEADGWFYCDGIIWDKQAIDLVKNQGWNVSCTYDFESDFTKGIYHGKPYDMKFTNGEFLHLALVDNPRYEGANIVMNSKTVVQNFNPNHDELGRFCSSSVVCISNDDYLNPKQDYTLPNISNDILKQLGKENKPLVLKKNIIEKNKLNHPEVDIKEYNDILSNSIYKPDLILQVKPNKKPNYFTFVKKDPETNKISVIELSETKEQHEVVNFFKVDDKRLMEYIKNTETEGGEILITNRNNPKGAAHLSALMSGVSNSITHLQENFNPSEQEILKNEGDITMTVMNALEEFIKKVVQNKGEEMTVENSKEDKRKLIDEVGGILKGKIDEELWRTVIGKIEKIAYEGSEDSKADNEADKEEKEEKFEEEKEIAENKCHKAKNEDKEDDEEKKEKKCEAKNSMDDVRKAVYGGAEEVKSLYISQAQRLEEGNKY